MRYLFPRQFETPYGPQCNIATSGQSTLILTLPVHLPDQRAPLNAVHLSGLGNREPNRFRTDFQDLFQLGIKTSHLVNKGDHSACMAGKVANDFNAHITL